MDSVFSVCIFGHLQKVLISSFKEDKTKKSKLEQGEPVGQTNSFSNDTINRQIKHPSLGPPPIICTCVLILQYPKSPSSHLGLLQEPQKKCMLAEKHYVMTQVHLFVHLWRLLFGSLLYLSVSLHKPGRSLIILETSIPLFHLVKTGQAVQKSFAEGIGGEEVSK